MDIIDTFTLPESDAELNSLFANSNPPGSSFKATTKSRGGWRGYDRVYSKYLSGLKNNNINLLEIGLYGGYGLLVWLKYFKNSKVHGIELEESYISSYNMLMAKNEEFSRVTIDFLDSTDKDSWNTKIRPRKLMFDIITDDGSHLPADQVKTLNNAWEFLNPGGYFFIEDISTMFKNPTCEHIFNELREFEKRGNEVVVYSHIKQKNITDHIAVIKKTEIPR